MFGVEHWQHLSRERGLNDCWYKFSDCLGQVLINAVLNSFVEGDAVGDLLDLLFSERGRTQPTRLAWRIGIILLS